ncbi:MAG TPA: 30S ribosome-binding factor RbfA [Candidatus Blautia stercorigallinarum]|uniref:Ribosome-binding factor A n=1 Tax=Candidatus Blautia stercorigallinarum TaxID=2838501 RepID=A0A9D1PBF2_9FIRM|nr:30S ribosome-binding factor RbfA [Candidatus Blautia stercorigallinarum]
MRKNSIKNTRINTEVQHELANLIRGGIKDPRIHPMTSVTAVEVAPDLKTCRAYISVLGDDEAKRNTLEGLKNAEGYIRRQLAKTINLRNTPEIRFILDESIEYGVAMSKLIDEVSKKEDAQEVQEDGEDNQ